MTHIPTHYLPVQVTDTTPDDDGEVTFHFRRGHGGPGFDYCDPADLLPIPADEMPIEALFPVGSRWQVGDQVVEITDTRQDGGGYIGAMRRRPDGSVYHAAVHPNNLATAERLP